MKNNVCYLSDIAEIFSGFAFRSQDLEELGIPVIKIANIQNKRVLPECSDHFPENLLSRKLERYFLQDQDCLVAMTGAGSVGKFGKMCSAKSRKYLVNQRVGIIRPDLSLCDPGFVFHVLSNDVYEKTLYSLGLGAGQPNVSAKEIGSLEIPLPPITTQRKISAILSAYDDLIENNLQRIKILREMAQNLYREWFVKFRFPGHQHVHFTDSSLGRIPEGWVSKNLLSIADVTYGFAFQSKQFNTDGNGMPIVRIRNVLAGTSDTFSPEEPDKKYLVKNGDILVGMDGDFHMGFWIGGQAYLVQRVARFRPKGEMGWYHLFLALQDPIQNFNATITGTTVAHLGDKHIKTIEIIWPQAKLINQLNNFLEPMLAQILNLRIKNTTLSRTSDLLLPRLISGDVDVSELVIRSSKEIV